MNLRFVPDTHKARREAMFAAAASFVVAPIYFWWKGFSGLLGGILITLGTFVLLSARASWMLYIRGLDTLVLDDDGVHLRRRNASADFRWEELHRVYRFGEVLAFESHAPHRRYMFSLEGHEADEKAIVTQLRASASTMDLRWAEGLTELS